MIPFTITLNQIIVLAVMGAIGYGIRKLNYVTDEGVAGLSFILLNVCNPCIALTALQAPYSAENLKNGILTMLGFGSVMLMGAGLAFLCTFLLRIRGTERKVWVASAAMPNAVFIGLPIMDALYGSDVIFFICFTNIAFSFVAYCFVVPYMQRGKGGAHSAAQLLASVLKTPAVIACFVGLAIYVTETSLPAPVFKAADYVAKATVPIAMLVVGAFVSKLPFKLIFAGKNVYCFSLLRLIVIPVAAVFIFRNFITNDMARNVVLLSGAMPVAAATPVFAEQYLNAGETGAKYTVVSTIFALATLPLIAIFVHMF